MKIILQSIVESIASRNDGSVKFVLGTQEMDASQAGNLFQLRGRFVKCLLSDSNISPLEEKLVDEEQLTAGKKAKSPAQRLRSVLFRLHEARSLHQKESAPFDMFYQSEMETLIERYKEVLNQETQ